jgi:hypothetical protein
MDDPGSALSAAGQRGAARDQRVDEGIVPMSGRRVNDQSRGLVDDGEMLVLEQDLEQNGGRSEGTGRLSVGEPNDDSVGAGEKARSAGRCAVHGDGTVGDQASRLCAGESQLIGEKAIEALGRRDRNGECQLRQPMPTPFRGDGNPPARGRWRGRSRRSSPRYPRC